MDSYPADHQSALTEAFARWEAFLRSDASEYGSAFWRLAMQVINDFGPTRAAGENPLNALAWTNLSKLSSVKSTAPEADAALQRHQVLANVLLKLEGMNYGPSPLSDETSRPR